MERNEQEMSYEDNLKEEGLFIKEEDIETWIRINVILDLISPILSY